jgi:hypothetical protein
MKEALLMPPSNSPGTCCEPIASQTAGWLATSGWQPPRAGPILKVAATDALEAKHAADS